MGTLRRTWRRAASLLSVGSVCLWTILGACTGDVGTTPTAPEDPEPIVHSIRALPCLCYQSPAGPDLTIGVLGRQVRIWAEALAEDGTVLYASSQDRFSWSSSAPDVATVEAIPSPFGGGGIWVLVTGVSDGVATITATSEGVSGELTVIVRDRARLAWSLPLSGDYMQADLAIGADGTIYVISFGGGRSQWFAVSPQGALLWTLDLPDTRSTPAIGADGTLYAGLRYGGLIAVSPGGAVRWLLEDIGEIRSSPAIGSDGTIYAVGGWYVHAIDPQGEVQWTYESPEHVFIFSSPALASDGTLYVGGTDGLLYALNPDGSLRWTFNAGGSNIIYSDPSIGRDGTIYFGALEGLFAVGPDGSGGRRLLERKVSRSPAIGSDGAVYVGGGWGTGGVGVYAINPGGSLRWNSPPAPTTTPILGADGTVYVTGSDLSGDQTVAALDSQGRLLWDYETPGGVLRVSPAIGIDGTILAVSGKPMVLYAIVENDGANGGYAGAPWPVARGNRTNNGRADR